MFVGSGPKVWAPQARTPIQRRYTVKTLLTNPRRGIHFASLAVVMACALSVPPNALALPPARTAARAGATAAKGGTSIQGVAWTSNNSPVPGARLQLRNVVSGKVNATAVANSSGQFTFTQIEGGRYVVEMLGANGKIVNVGHPFAIAPGETIATFVRMGPKVPFFSGFFGNAATAVASSAASQGITAIAPVQLKESR